MIPRCPTAVRQCRALVRHALLAVAMVPALAAAQVRSAQRPPAPAGQIARLSSGGDASGARPSRRPGAVLTAAQKTAVVRSVSRAARLQPEAPIHLDATAVEIPGRAQLFVKHADLYAGAPWGLFLPATDSYLEFNVRLDAGKMHLLDCLVLNDRGGGTVTFKAGNQISTQTVGAQEAHLTWVFVPATSDWYRISMSGTSTGGGSAVQLEVSYCEITPFN